MGIAGGRLEGTGATREPALTALAPDCAPAEQARSVRRVEVFTGAGRWRRWSPEQKALIVSETYHRSIREL
jgi:hypothetical protein